MTEIKKKLPYLFLLAVIPLLGMIYTILNERTYTQVFELSTIIDNNIPFIPSFIIPYIIWYPFVFGYLIYFWYKDTEVYVKTLITIVVGELICFTIYFFFQTTVPRPHLTDNNLLTSMVQFIYNNDKPYNAFPSIHVLTTYAIMLASLNIKNKHKLNHLFIQIMGSLIILSTMFVKQHVVYDMIGSMFLVSVIYATAFQLNHVRKTQKIATEKNR